MKKLYRIDPYTETVACVATTDSLADLTRQLACRHIQMVALTGTSDVLILDADALSQPPYPPAWQRCNYDQHYYGIALWVHMTPEGKLTKPRTRLTSVRRLLQFVGFIQPQQQIDYLPLDEIGDRDEPA
ncbi:hypothetical protein CLV58_13119 [Spirosoma oryzae]|uniref:Uncharacterized protein n=1 Tax=Spirosoma oryzae TaxID=1469603 RepID=A0A2T0S306_9BACT|nr:hypothetical protein [Spirosoma oryzae]PRY27801.1 hypothetical protein CLV58_13119 [Spirosoma oryzae]